MSDRQVLITAEPYGFGPSSKALAIAREFRVNRCLSMDFAGSGTAHDAASREGELFGKVVLMRRHDADSLSESVSGYGLLISVMEPSLALAAAAAEIPCVYVDSLFWMWDWPDDLADVAGPHERLITALGGESREQRREALRVAIDLPMHEAQYVAHRVATRVLYQRYGSGRHPTQWKSRDLCSAMPVGAIVDKVSNGTQSHPRHSAPGVVISVSGLANELTDRSVALGWARTVIDLMDDSIRGTAFEKVGIRIGGNTEILHEIGTRAGAVIDIRPWESHEEFMLDLGQAAVFAAPPGITSIAESWSASVPFFALPSQHYAHASILERLRGDDMEAFPGIDVNHKNVRGDLVDVTTTVLNSVVAEFGVGASNRTAGIDRLHGFFLRLEDDRAVLVEKQSQRLSALFGDAHGAAAVVSEALMFS